MVEQKLRERGHLCKFFPKFHCELNVIERCWCHAKKYTRAHSNGSILRLRKIILEEMDTCDSTLIKKFFRTYRDYMKMGTLAKMWMQLSRNINPTGEYLT